MVGGLEGRQVCVSGGGGFIGGRLVERLLLEEKASVRALVHRPAGAVWLSRTQAELVPGDVTCPESLPAALAGCEIVFHCAALLGGDAEEMYRVNVLGTENMLAAARQAGVARFVHVSSMAVLGRTFPDGADETTPPRPGNDPYARTKWEAEEQVRAAYRQEGLPAVIVRPTIVYGPRSPWWTVDPILRLKQGRLALLGRGNGVANVVYVDDVVEALLLAATVPGVEGEVFFVSSEERTTWRDFYGAYARMLGKRLPAWPLPLAWIVTGLTQALDRSIENMRGPRQRPTGLRSWLLLGLRAGRKMVGPLYKLGRWEIAMYRSRTQINIAKARQHLGYRSTWPLARAMKETERWLCLQGYLPEKT